MKMSEHARNRNFFEADESFPDAMSLILDGYDSASKIAASSARRAIQTGSDQHTKEAMWWEAVAQTMERCIVTLKEGEEFLLPARPSFDGQ